MEKIIHGDCLEKLKELPENSVDSIVTDPPYGLEFMGKAWDKFKNGENTGGGTINDKTKVYGRLCGKAPAFYNIDNNAFQDFCFQWSSECLRVLKPGGHLLSFGGTRTYHRMACAIEDAGFEIRDMIEWVYGSGFPKSLNVSLQIKKKYNIGLCTCNVFEPMIELGYENSNNKRDNISNGDNDGLGVSEQIQHKGTDNNEMAKQVKDTDISPDSSIRKESGMFELPEADNKKEQGFEEVGKSILQQRLCKSISENEGLGNTAIRTGVEESETTGERKGQGLSDMQNKTTNGIASPSSDTIQNGGEEHNGEPCGSLSELPQQDRENNRKRIEQIKNDCNAEEWNNLSRFICSKCYCLKKDIGGTALKPAHEPICMARKPLAEKTVAENVLKWGTGGINIDESRVDFVSEKDLKSASFGSRTKNPMPGGGSTNGNEVWEKDIPANPLGRFPANLIHDGSDEVKECFPETKSGGGNKIPKKDDIMFGACRNNIRDEKFMDTEPDSGNASRFFKSIIYQAKASRAERNRGCEGLEEKEEVYPGINTLDENGNRLRADGSVIPPLKSKNNHPTVKPIALMEYLIKMVTPKGGIVLDPFTGSGSTLIAAKKNGFKFIGIEKEAEYVKIAEARLSATRVENKLF